MPTFAVAIILLQGCENVDFEILMYQRQTELNSTGMEYNVHGSNVCIIQMSIYVHSSYVFQVQTCSFGIKQLYVYASDLHNIHATKMFIS